MTDTERLDWLEGEGMGLGLVGLIHNDSRHWAVLFDGVQNVPDEASGYGENPFPLSTSFWCYDEVDDIQAQKLERFKPTVREAIDYAMAHHYEDGDDG